MPPGLAAVVRAIDAVAARDVAPDARFPHSDVDDVGVCVGNGNRADRRGTKEPIGDVGPSPSRVFGFPDTAPRRPEVEDLFTRWVASDGDNAAASERPDLPPPQRIEESTILIEDHRIHASPPGIWLSIRSG